MTQLSARARSLLDRARREAAPSANELVRLRGRLAASLAGQAPDPVLLPFSVGKLAGVVMAAAVGLGAWHLRGAFDGPERRPAVLVPVAPAAPPPAPVVAEAVSCPPVPSCAPAPAAKPVACAPAKAAGADDEALARRRMRHDLFSAAAAQRDASLELQLLLLARDALDEDRATDALGHALRHEELYPNSAFEEERLAIQVLAWCSAGNGEKAAQRFERLVELAPQTTYLPRIRATCPDGLTPPAGEAEQEP